MLYSQGSVAVTALTSLSCPVPATAHLVGLWICPSGRGFCWDHTAGPVRSLAWLQTELERPLQGCSRYWSQSAHWERALFHARFWDADYRPELLPLLPRTKHHWGVVLCCVVIFIVGSIICPFFFPIEPLQPAPRPRPSPPHCLSMMMPIACELFG